MLSKENKYNEQDNDWAKNLEDDYIHISQAESGSQGYYCLGCDKEMLAAKGLIKKHYFRHVVKDADNSKKECVNSSREYREKLAYYYFMRVKKINLPAIYKYPPKGVEGLPYLLEEKQTIYAHRVDREVTFFEDENGVIHSGKNTDVDERYLWIRPDAVFYDANDKPILFVEFIVSHKPDNDKINKLRRLGINTVQIIVPKKIEEELEKEISKASKVKWTYNEIESDTEYIPVSKGNSEGIPSIDEEQRKLFEESFACRRAQVENLIRSITRCVESQQYRRIAELFGQEISRIEEATKRERTRLADIQAGIEREIDSELGGSRTGFEERNRKFQTEKTDLEERYTRKRSEINGKIFSINRDIDFREGIGGTEDGIRRDFEGRKRELELERIHIETEEGRIAKQEREIDVSIGEESSIPGDFEQRRSEVEQSFEGKRQDLESKISGFREIQNEEEGRIRAEFEGINKQIAERISQRDILQQDELSPRIKTILELWRVFDNYENGRETLLRYRSGIEIIKSGTWKEWD